MDEIVVTLTGSCLYCGAVSCHGNSKEEKGRGTGEVACAWVTSHPQGETQLPTGEAGGTKSALQFYSVVVKDSWLLGEAWPFF